MPGPPESTGDHKLNLTEVERALIYAQGKVLTLLVTTLQAKSHLDGREFADLLGLFSALAGEEDDLQGAILATWSGIMKDGVPMTA